MMMMMRSIIVPHVLSLSILFPRLPFSFRLLAYLLLELFRIGSSELDRGTALALALALALFVSGKKKFGTGLDGPAIKEMIARSVGRSVGTVVLGTDMMAFSPLSFSYFFWEFSGSFMWNGHC